MRTLAVQRAARSMSWRSESIVRLPPRRETDASGAEGFTSIQHSPTGFLVRAASRRSESIDDLPPVVSRNRGEPGDGRMDGNPYDVISCRGRCRGVTG